MFLVISHNLFDFYGSACFQTLHPLHSCMHTLASWQINYRSELWLAIVVKFKEEAILYLPPLSTQTHTHVHYLFPTATVLYDREMKVGGGESSAIFFVHRLNWVESVGGRDEESCRKKKKGAHRRENIPSRL